ncbi:YoaK family protein [Eisenibacter elegans]|uniref:YoaK family protein n=1 Tax=Eisenibacter elegans TaxID=997 RepID=UPI00040F4B12|nr:YoaK family protein [Eisenibacter elegans]
MGLFDSRGKDRSLSHNLSLASLLSLAAGAVNSASWFAFQELTTNVTGHAALLSNHLVAREWELVELKILLLLLFVLGAFTNTVIIEAMSKRYQRYAHTPSLVIEMAILLFIATYGGYLHYNHYSPAIVQLLAGSLLFAMGLQNAMVTTLSGAVVRTTHLTGLFTDMGINLAKRFVHRDKSIGSKLILQFSIVGGFLSGGILGAFLFSKFLYNAYYFPLMVLLGTLLFDVINFRAPIYKAQQLLPFDIIKPPEAPSASDTDHSNPSSPNASA